MKKLLLEGGNAIPGAKPIKKEDFPAAMKTLNDVLKKAVGGLETYPIGSAGKKTISSDIDVLIDAKEVLEKIPAKDLKSSRVELESRLSRLGLTTSRSGVSVHVGIPVNDDIVQVDLMAVENAKMAQPLHSHDYIDDDMKGGELHKIWADLTNMSSYKGHEKLMLSPYKGIVDRETKELLVSDKDAIAKIIIGPTATADDLGNRLKILKALEQYPYKYKVIKDKYFSAPTVQEWFRKTIDILK